MENTKPVRWTFYPLVEVTPNDDGTYRIVLDWSYAQETYAWDADGNELEARDLGTVVLNAWLDENGYQPRFDQPQVLVERFVVPEN